MEAFSQENLIFLISTPRSGSTMLMRILHATSAIVSRAEPHLIPPLAHLGFWETVEKAPFDQLQSQQAMRELVAELPNKEEDYYRACRAYCDVLYANMLQISQEKKEPARYFLDKTPANALVLPFLLKVYPKAKYIFLTRHPGAIFSSYANSFFDGDYQAAVDFNPILSRYIPVMAQSLRDNAQSTNPSPILHISYENMVSHPEDTLQQISQFLDIPFEKEALEYKKSTVSEGLGDPLGVNKHARPVTSSKDKWVEELVADKKKFAIVAKQLAGVSEEDLATWGTPRADLWTIMEQVDASKFAMRKQEWNRYLLTRKLLVWLRRDIHNRVHGRWIKKIRMYCDVLLRG